MNKKDVNKSEYIVVKGAKLEKKCEKSSKKAQKRKLLGGNYQV